MQRTLEHVLPHFTGFSLLGSGGQGAVYEVYDPSLGMKVALKVCWHDPGAEDLNRTRDRFFREFDLLCRARTCENVVGVFRRDAAQSRDRRQTILWYTMELCQEAVSSRVGAMGPTHRAQIAGQLVHAVAHLSAQGIAHRDIKPQNLFLVRAPPEGPVLVKLGDFGIARSVVTGDQLARTLTAADVVHGTGRYLPPEVVDTASRDPVKGDQYAAGVVTYELLSRGRMPYGEPPSHLLALLRLKGSGTYLPLQMPDFDGHLEPVDRVLRRMTLPDPAERFRTMGDAERALHSALLSSDLLSS